MFYNTYFEKCETILFFAEQSQTNTSCLPGCVNTSDHSDPSDVRGELVWQKSYFFHDYEWSCNGVIVLRIIGSHHAGQRLRPFATRRNYITKTGNVVKNPHFRLSWIILIGARLASSHS